MARGTDIYIYIMNIKIQFLSHISLFQVLKKQHAASGYHMAQHQHHFRYCEVLLNSAALEDKRWSRTNRGLKMHSFIGPDASTCSPVVVLIDPLIGTLPQLFLNS